jgi:hypothetical protein
VAIGTVANYPDNSSPEFGEICDRLGSFVLESLTEKCTNEPGCKIGQVIVSWNRSEKNAACMRSLRDLPPKQVELISNCMFHKAKNLEDAVLCLKAAQWKMSCIQYNRLYNIWTKKTNSATPGRSVKKDSFSVKICMEKFRSMEPDKSQKIAACLTEKSNFFETYSCFSNEGEVPMLEKPNDEIGVATAGDQSSMTNSMKDRHIEGTWLDHSTGIYWQIDATSFRIGTLEEAKLYCSNIKLGGFKWRLPSIGELRTLVRCRGFDGGFLDKCQVSMSCLGRKCHDDEKCNGICSDSCYTDLNCIWPNTLKGDCKVGTWSSTSVEDVPDYYWYMAFDYGPKLSADNNSEKKGARCVRADGSGEHPGIWTDENTGLTWYNPPVGELRKVRWTAARRTCAVLDFDGGQWRLPTITELGTLVRACNGDPMKPCEVSEDCLSQSCWSERSCTWRKLTYTDNPIPPGVCNKSAMGQGACFWPEELVGPCSDHWSSSEVSNVPGYAWIFNFKWDGAGIGIKQKCGDLNKYKSIFKDPNEALYRSEGKGCHEHKYVRCVR